MNRYLKTLAVSASLILAVSLLGCGGNEKKADTKSAANTSGAWKADGPITIINPYKAGGAGDLEVKALQPILEKELGVPVVTEYITGGGGSPAIERVFEAKPDGRTILYLNNPAASIMELTDKVTYKLNDFTYLQNVSTEYRCIAVLDKSEFKTLADVVNKAKAGGKISIAHSGIGSSGHLQTLLVEKALGIKLNDIPFDGTGPAKAAFLGGHVDLWAIDTVTAAQMVKTGDARVLGVCAPKPDSKLPGVKTFKELGYDVVVSTSRGFVAPPKTPENIASALSTAMNKAVTSPEMKTYADRSGTSIDPVSGAEYKQAAMNVYSSVNAVKDLFQ